MSLSRTLGTLLALLTLGLIPGPSPSAGAADDEVTISHHLTLDLGRDAITKIFTAFEQKTGVKMVDDPTGHEDFKAAILVMAAGQDLPDVFSYCAGARTAIVVESGALQFIDDLYRSAILESIVPASIGDAPRLAGSRLENPSYPVCSRQRAERISRLSIATAEEV
jgi:ABC-type glycerol-3-phosphate transport system substrate-binding protein